MTKILIKFVVLAFLVLVCSSFIGNLLLEQRRGHQVWNNFYELPHNSIDIVFLGNSLSYSSFNPLVFNGFLGVSSYNLGTADQNIKQSYYNLKEVIEHQLPKMVILEDRRAHV